jgi:hypothetical protein
MSSKYLCRFKRGYSASWSLLILKLISLRSDMIWQVDDYYLEILRHWLKLKKSLFQAFRKEILRERR